MTKTKVKLVFDTRLDDIGFKMILGVLIQAKQEGLIAWDASAMLCKATRNIYVKETYEVPEDKEEVSHD